jgi:ABC-type tungstate transport system permease subunit
MRIAKTIIFLFFPIVLLAQTQTGIKEKEISLTLFASPDYSFGYIPRGVGIGSSILMRYEDKGILAYTFGLVLKYNFKPRLAVSLGLNKSRKGYNTLFFSRNLITVVRDKF